MDGKKRKSIEEKKEKIQELGLDAIKKYFEIDVDTLESLKPEVLRFLDRAALLGMRFEREMNITKRTIDSNFIRLSKLFAKDQKEIIDLVKKSLPEYHQALTSEREKEKKEKTKSSD